MRVRSSAVTVLGCLVLSVCPGSPVAAQPRDAFETQRQRMVVDSIEREGVSNERVLESMRRVPRHEFVGIRERPQAYFDYALPIGHKQTISPPFIVAYMTECIDPQPSDRVLEIGTGSGYQAAVLSGLVADIYTIEIVEPLGKQAERRLERLGYSNVKVKIGDGYKGWPEQAPFDKIIVTCSPEDVPQPLVEQLREGGKMIVPLGERYQQVFYLFEKQDGKLVRNRLIPTLFVPMTGISEQQRQVQPDPLRPEIVNGGFELDENEDGLADNWHYQRQATLVSEDAPADRNFIRFDNEEPGRMGHALQGLPVDGSRIAQLRVELRYRSVRTSAGLNAYERPALLIHFYDSQRRPVGDAVVGPWLGTSDWRQISELVPVPSKAREAVVRIGLNGATGRLEVDEVSLAPVER